MDAVGLAEWLPCIALAMALAACAGLRAWLPLLLTGVLARAGVLDLGQAYGFLASNQALAAFGLATVVELVADKVPALDHALDAVSTVLRPAAGTLLAASVLWPVSDPLAALVLGLAIGAPAALVPHGLKAGLRAASTALTAGIANPVLSLIEDVAAVVMFIVAVVAPLLIASLLLLAGVLVVGLLARRRPRVRTA